MESFAKNPIKDAPERTLPVKNEFVHQFAKNINFKYTCFDRVIIRGYIRRLFFPVPTDKKWTHRGISGEPG